MLVRQIVVPANADELWDALTEPDQVESWFGSRVEWDLRPGGRARFFEGNGTVRAGEIDAVEPGRHLRFRWWAGDDGDPTGASEVSYDLEPDDGGTRLTVTEQPVPTAAPGTASARAASWTTWDSRMFGCWACACSLSLAGR
jgi:uncharacterized protein YndB with AHSA1/START domain